MMSVPSQQGTQCRRITSPSSHRVVPCKERSSRDISRAEEVPTDEGRRARFEALYADLMPRVLGYALRRTDAEEARDVVSETFTVAWRRFDESTLPRLS